MRINRSRLSPLIVGIVFFIASVLAPAKIYGDGLTGADLDAVNNGWEHWVGTADCTSGAETAGASATDITLNGNDNAQKVYNFLLSKGLTPTQSAAFIGNFMVESSVDPTSVQKDGPGRGIAQWGTGGRWDTGNQSLKSFAAGKNVLLLETQVQFVWYELSKTSYQTVLNKIDKATAIDQMTEIISTYYEQAGKPNLPLRIKYAKEAQSLYGGSQVAVSSPAASATESGCYGAGSESGAIAGDIVQTALNYAWKTRGHGPNESDAKPNYRKDMPIYNGSTGDLPFSDCGVFVSTVMIASGADKNYPKRGTSIQLAYLQNHLDKYQPIPNVTNTSQLKPGDILVKDGHTYLYTGRQNTGYNSVGGSLHSHVPEVGNFYAGFSVFRLIKGDVSA